MVFVPQLLAARVVNQDRTSWETFEPELAGFTLWAQKGIPLIICEAMYQAAVPKHADTIPSGVLNFVHEHVSVVCSY